MAALAQRVEELAKAEKPDALLAFCKQELAAVKATSGARSYLLAKAAHGLAAHKHIDEANELYRRAATEAPLQPFYVAIQVYDNWGSDLWEANLWSASWECYKEGLRRFDGGSPANEAYFLEQLADGSDRANALREGIGYARRAITIRRSLGDQIGLKESITQLSVLHFELGDLAFAEVEARRALAIAIRLGEPLAGQFNNMGSVLYTEGRLTEAETYLLKSVAAGEKEHIPDPALAILWTNLGALASDRNNMPRAEYYLERAIALFEKAGPSVEDRLEAPLGSLADIKRLEHQNGEALALIKRAQSIAERTGMPGARNVPLLIKYAWILSATGDLTGAKATAKRAQDAAKAANPRGIDFAEATKVLGELLAYGGELAEAEVTETEASKLLATLQPTGTQHAEALAELAKIEDQRGETDVALENYEHALTIYGAENRLPDRGDSLYFVERYSDCVSGYAALLWRLGRKESAFEVRDSSRAITLNKMLRQSHIELLGAGHALQLENERKLERRLAELSDQRVRMLAKGDTQSVSRIEQEIGSTAVERDLIEQRLRREDPRYAAMTQPVKSDIKQLERMIEPDTALIEYSMGEKTSYVSVLRQQGLTSWPLPPEKEIGQLARTVHEAWSKPSKPGAGPDTAARQLSDLILVRLRMRFATSADW